MGMDEATMSAVQQERKRILGLIDSVFLNTSPTEDNFEHGLRMIYNDLKSECGDAEWKS